MHNGNIILNPDEQERFTKLEYKRYAYVVKVNYTDNKWFPPDLRREMSLLKAGNPTKYLEVWEGFTKQTLDGAIYADELRQTLIDGRRKKVTYDPFKPVYTFWDLGHHDMTAIWFIQRVGMEYNVINYYQNRLKKLPHYLEHMKSLGYNYGTVYQPHDGDNETLAARSIASLTRAAGYKVIVVNKPPKKVVGINAARTVFELCNFDEENTKDGWQCLSRYAYKVNEETGNFSREPDHDTPWSHGADGFQTFALSLKTEDDTRKRKPKVDLSKLNNQPRAWMGHL
jgi:phage terminase large subunit